MRKLYLYLRALLFGTLPILISALGQAQAQAPNWQMAMGFESTGFATRYTTVRAMAADASGNIYLVGDFNGAVSFGSTSLTSGFVGSDGFVAKWSTAANRFVWALRVGDVNNEFCNAIAVSGTSIYITGTFNSSSLTLGTTTLTNQSPVSYGGGPPYPDLFVAKIADNGNTAAVVWGQGVGGNNVDEGLAIAVRGADVYIAGNFSSSLLSLGTIKLPCFPQVPGPAPRVAPKDIFVAKLTDAGVNADFVWANSAGGVNDENFQSMAIVGTDVYLSGYSNGPSGGFSAAFGPVVLPLSTPTAYFIAKLAETSATSGFVWAQASPVSVDALNAQAAGLYMAGAFNGTATLGPTTLTASGASDAYIAKWSTVTNGFVWATRAGGANSEAVAALAVNGSDIYITGGFNSPAVTFGSTVLAASSSGTSTSDVFVAKLTDAGTSAGFDWARQAGGTGSNLGNALAVVGPTVFVAGRAVSPAAFGSHSIQVGSSGSSPLGFFAALAAGSLAATAPNPLAELTLFPNPAHGKVTIQLPSIPSITTFTLTVLDALGRTLRTQTTATSARTELDLAGLPAGLYAVRVQAAAATATQRLVVE